MRELGLNTLGFHNGGTEIAKNIPEKMAPALCPEFRAHARECGVSMEFEVHAGSSLLPRSLFEMHPEYFAWGRLLDGRIPDSNWCVTDPEAEKIIRRNAVALGNLLAPDTHRYLFWGDDGGEWCRCPRCHEFNDAEQALLAANQMAEALGVFDPEAQVPFLAYLNTLDIPRRVKPHERVFLEFAPMKRCWKHAIDDPSCAVNRFQWNLLLQLLELFPPERVHILEYWLDSSYTSRWKRPAKKVFFQKENAAADIAAYHALGIRSLTTFAVFMDGEYFRNHGDRELREYAELLNRYE
jgi:hypothetical protein